MSTDRPDRIAQLAELIAELATALAQEPPVPAPAIEPAVLLDIAEAARLLNVSRAKLYNGPSSAASC